MLEWVLSSLYAIFIYDNINRSSRVIHMHFNFSINTENLRRYTYFSQSKVRLIIFVKSGVIQKISFLDIDLMPSYHAQSKTIPI